MTQHDINLMTLNVIIIVSCVLGMLYDFLQVP